MNSRLKFSDVIKYVFPGGVFVLFLYVTLYFLLDESIWEKYINPFDGTFNNSFSHQALLVIVLIFFCYIFGVMWQGVRIYFSQFIPSINKNFTNNKFGRLVLCPSYSYYYKHYCKVLKYKEKRKDLPNWIYISDNPEETSDIIEQIVNSSEEQNNDSKYINTFMVCLVVLSRSFMFVLFLLILYIYFCEDVLLNLQDKGQTAVILCLIFLVLSFIFILCARAFAVRYIKYLHSAFEAQKIKSPKLQFDIYKSISTPKVYVLIRTRQLYVIGNKNVKERKNSKHLERALRSIENQTYKNIHVIILEDLGDKDANSLDKKKAVKLAEETKQLIEKFVTEREEGSIPPLKISYQKSYCDGAAGAVWGIKNAFNNLAEDRDICIMLDDDDTFSRNDAVEDIVTQFSKFKADICITSFENQDSIELSITNKNGSTHKEETIKLSQQAAKRFNSNLCYLSSIGWTKSLNKKTCSRYMSILKPYETEFKKLKFYENFPDLVLFLLRDVKTTGVAKPTHSYFKHPDSVTTSVSIKAFDTQRVGFLVMLVDIVCRKDIQSLLIPFALSDAVRFVIFKIIQIENIMAGNVLRAKNLDANYSCFNDIQFLDFTKWFCDEIGKRGLADKVKEALSTCYGVDNSGEILNVVYNTICIEQKAGFVDVSNILTCYQEKDLSEGKKKVLESFRSKTSKSMRCAWFNKCRSVWKCRDRYWSRLLTIIRKSI